MIPKTIFFLFFLCYSSFLFANGVGSSMQEVLKTNFADFFNISEQSSSDLKFKQKRKHYKTGGFQEFVDLYFTVNNKNTLVSAKVVTKYSFLKDKGILAKDIIKSFIADFAHEKDRAVCKTLSDFLWKNEGEVAVELNPIMNVLKGKKKQAAVALKGCVLAIYSEDESIVFSYHEKNWKSAAIPKSSFIDEAYLTNQGMKKTQDETFMQIWGEKETARGAFQRVVDGRWLFETEEGAYNYYNAYIQKQSEGASKLSDFSGKLGDCLEVYYMNKDNNSFLATLGVEETYYYFIFRQRKYMAKVFVVANKGESINKAFQLAKRASKQMN